MAASVYRHCYFFWFQHKIICFESKYFKWLTFRPICLIWNVYLAYKNAPQFLEVSSTSLLHTLKILTKTSRDRQDADGVP